MSVSWLTPHYHSTGKCAPAHGILLANQQDLHKHPIGYSRDSLPSAHRTGTSMAAPFAAGFAALLLSHLAREDYKLYGRGLEVKNALASVSSLSGPLASSGIVYWGQQTSPNAVLDWGLTCQYVSDGQERTPDFSLTGQSGDRPRFDDVGSYVPRSAGTARTSSILVEFFRSAGGNTPQFYVSDLAPQPDFARAVSRGIDFGPATGGAARAAHG